LTVVTDHLQMRKDRLRRLSELRGLIIGTTQSVATHRPASEKTLQATSIQIEAIHGAKR